MAGRLIYRNLVAPFADKISDTAGNLSISWQQFFQSLTQIVAPISVEKTFALENGKTTIVGNPDRDNIQNLSFNKQSVSQARVDYLIQRWTTNSATPPTPDNSQEKVETGHFFVAYLPKSDSWVLTGGPSSSGITLSITSSGQVQYTSSLLSGTSYISRFVWRSHTMAAKHSAYSQMIGAS